jgi:hypothetical protein
MAPTDRGRRAAAFHFSAILQIANRKSTGGFKRLQRIGNDAAANHNLIGCAHKILDWPHKGAKARKRIILRDFASAV